MGLKIQTWVLGFSDLTTVQESPWTKAGRGVRETRPYLP